MGLLVPRFESELAAPVHVRLIANRWRIVRKIGAGATSSVYEAEGSAHERVALKILHPILSRDRGARARFVREARIAASLGHPGVPKVYATTTTDDGSAVLVEELVTGEALDAMRERLGGRVDAGVAVLVIDALLDVLEVAHARGIVHRDVKPDNVILTPDGGLKLLDFGLARVRDDEGASSLVEATGTGVTLGTPAYIAPEQALGQSELVGPASDVWSVGAVLYALLSGHEVHEGGTAIAVLLAKTTQPVRPLAEVDATIPALIAEVVDRSLARDVTERFPDAGSMRRALRRAAGLPTVTSTVPPPLPPPSPSEASLDLQDDDQALAAMRSSTFPSLVRRPEERGRSSLVRLATTRSGVVAILIAVFAVTCALLLVAATAADVDAPARGAEAAASPSP